MAGVLSRTAGMKLWMRNYEILKPT